MSNKKSVVIRNQPSKIKLIIFDFDGVLADSFETLYLLIKDSFAHIDFKLTRNQYKGFFNGDVHQGFKNFISNKEKYLSFSEFRKNNYDKYYYNKKNKVKFFLGAREFIAKLKGKHVLAIASSGHQKNIKNLLEDGGIKNLFNFVLANTSTDKEGMIREILHKSGLKPEETVMISDTVGDIIMAKKAGLRTLAVTWGFHSKNKLKNSNPYAIVKSFKELLGQIDKLSQ